MKREPISIINAIVTAIQATIPLLLAFGIATISKEQSAASLQLSLLGVASWGHF